MSYESKHRLRASVLAIARKIDRKTIIDTEQYNILVKFHRKDWSYLDILEIGRKLVKSVVAIDGIKAEVVDTDEDGLQFSGPGVEITVRVGHEGVSLFLCENSHTD